MTYGKKCGEKLGSFFSEHSVYVWIIFYFAVLLQWVHVFLVCVEWSGVLYPVVQCKVDDVCHNLKCCCECELETRFVLLNHLMLSFEPHAGSLPRASKNRLIRFLAGCRKRWLTWLCVSSALSHFFSVLFVFFWPEPVCVLSYFVFSMHCLLIILSLVITTIISD